MLTCGFASHRTSNTLAQRSNSNPRQDGVDAEMGGSVGTADRERSRLYPSSRQAQFA